MVCNLADDAHVVSIASSRADLFRTRSDQDVWDTVDYMNIQKGVMTEAVFQRYEKAAGFNHTPEGHLLCVPLRRHVGPVSACVNDPLHVWFQGGVASVELYEMFEELVAYGITWAMVGDWMRADFMWPTAHRANGRALYTTFNSTREAGTRGSKREFKGGAIETAMVVPMLRHFLVKQAARSTDFADDLQLPIASFQTMVDVCVLLQRAKFSDDPDHFQDLLSNAIGTHLEAFKAAYGTERCKFKHHMAMHVRCHDLYLDTFCLER